MKSTFDKNAEKFVNLMVEKIESLSMNWQKPWFSKVNSKQNFLPQNLTGRTYSGGNAFLLYFLCEKYNYQTPVDRKSTRLNSSHNRESRMPSSA